MKAIFSLGVILLGTMASVVLAEQGTTATLGTVKLEKSQLDSITAASSKNAKDIKGVSVIVTNVDGRVTKDIKFIKDKDSKFIKRDVVGLIKEIAKRRAEVVKLSERRFADRRILDRVSKKLMSKIE